MKMIKMNFITGFKKSDFSSSNKFFTSMVIGLMLTVLAGVASSQSDSILADNFPERYVVVKGDTLWVSLAVFYVTLGVGLKFGKVIAKLKTQTLFILVIF